MRIFLMRHGETDWNVSGKLTSSTDIPLNDRGVAQISTVASALAGVEFCEVRCSPMARAQRTAKIIEQVNIAAGGMGPKLIIDDRLRELSFGGFEGLSRSELADRGLLSDFEAWTRGQKDVGGAESLQSAKSRAEALFEDMRVSSHRNVLLVTHGHFARILLICCVLGGQPGNHRAMRMDNGLFAQVNVTDNDIRLVSFNSSSPLD